MAFEGGSGVCDRSVNDGSCVYLFRMRYGGIGPGNQQKVRDKCSHPSSAAKRSLSVLVCLTNCVRFKHFEA
jgi:hypothetical protein